MNFFALWVKGAIKKVKADDKEGHLFAEYDTMYFTKEELERSLHLQKQPVHLPHYRHCIRKWTSDSSILLINVDSRKGNLNLLKEQEDNKKTSVEEDGASKVVKIGENQQ
jgi:hypothetical protein